MAGAWSGQPVRGPPVDLPPGFRWVYTRGYDLAVPVRFALRWVENHAPSPSIVPSRAVSAPRHPPERLERRVYPQRRLEKVTRWEIVPPDQVTFHDEVFQRGRLVVEGEERYRFIGEGDSGCIVEVTALRRPVGWTSRIGFALFPEWSVRTHRQEAAMFQEIEDDFRAGRRAEPRAAPSGRM